MALAYGSHVSGSGGLDKVFARAENVGAESIQLFTKSERQWNAKPLDLAVIENFFAERDRTGLSNLVVHDSYLINMASPKEDLKEKSIAAFVHELERCDTLEIPFLVTHPGAHTGSGFDLGIETFAASMNDAHLRLPEGKAMTLLETTAGQGTTLGSTFEELARIIALIDDKRRVGVCLDTCHVFAAGYDFRSPENYAAMMTRFDELIGLDLLKVIHVNDSKSPLDARRDRHEHIGKGEIGPEGFRNFVNDDRLSGIAAILETEKDDAGDYDRSNFATLRGLVSAQDAVPGTALTGPADSRAD